MLDAAETALLNGRVQGGKEQVLQDGAVVGIAAIPVVILQQLRRPMLGKQLAGDQPLFLEEPDEQQPRNQADDMLLRRPRNLFTGRKPGHGDRPLKPLKQFRIETPVERLGVQSRQPGVQQPVKIARLAMPVHPFQPRRQRQLAQNVQMRPVRIDRVDFPDQRHAAQHIPVRIIAIRPPMHKRQSNAPALG